MPRLRNVSIHLRQLGLVGLLIVGFLATMADMIRIQTDNAMNSRVAELHALVQTAKGIATELQKEESAGKITREAAISSFRSALHAMRYGSGDYIFAYANDGTVIAMPPQPELEGQNRIELKDPSGRFVIRDLLATAAAGGGVMRTIYPRPGTTVPLPKMNYVEPFQPWNMMIATGVFVDDLDAEAHALIIRTALSASLVIGLAVAVVWLLSRSISRPLATLETAMTSLAAGNLSVDVGQSDRGDEIGRMMRAFNVLKINAEEKRALEAARVVADHESHLAQRRTAGDVADRLQAQLGEVAVELRAASERLTLTAGDMRGATNLAHEEAISAKAMVDTTLTNVEMVAAATEQLASSVKEISGQIVTSSTIAVRAVDEARRTDSLVQTLAQTATRIGSIVQVISGIAGQTNLLALNATIEAARAGDAGKGFAVVAGEVKNLASQTGKATDEIAAQIEQIQTATQDAVAAIGNISSTIDEISHLSGTIAAAIEEQGAATREISRNVRQAASGTLEVSGRIDGANKAISTATGSAGQVLQAAETLSDQSRALTEQLGRLVDQVRAA